MQCIRIVSLLVVALAIGLGREGEAAAATRQATGWIKQRLVQAVPPEFRDSFRQRNPVHRELLVLARQLHV